MRIGRLAKELGISVSTVRFYERQGLIPKPTTTESGYREYSDSDLARLRLIISAKRQRFPLKVIRVVIGAVTRSEEPCDEIATMVEQRIHCLGCEIRDLQRLQTRLTGQLEAWKRGTLPNDDCLCAILESDSQKTKTTKGNKET